MTDTSGRDRPDVAGVGVDALTILAYGSAAAEQSRVSTALGLPASYDDEQFARAVVEHAAQAAAGGVQLDQPRGSTPPPRPMRDSSRPSRVSFPPRAAASLQPLGASGRPALRELDDLHTLSLIVKAASLFQRRAAVARIGEILQGVEIVSAEQRRQASDVLKNQAHAELAYDIGAVVASLPGGEGRVPRTEQRARHELAARVQQRVLAFWEGEHRSEPFSALSAEERAMLLPHARALSDVVIRHVSALIEDSAAHIAEPELRVLLTSLDTRVIRGSFPRCARCFWASRRRCMSRACARSPVSTTHVSRICSATLTSARRVRRSACC